MLPTRARVQAHRLSFVLALHERVPRAMDHRSSGCLPAEKFPTCASGRLGRGPATLLSFPSRFHLTNTTLLSIFLLSYVIFSKMTCRGVGRPTLATQH